MYSSVSLTRYCRLCDALLDDALDRFAMLG